MEWVWGELLRGGYLKGQPHDGNARKRVVNTFAHQFLRFDDLLLPEPREYHREYFAQKYLDRVGELEYAGALLDECYTQLRCGVWAAASQMRDAIPRRVPLCDNRILALAYSRTSSQQRANDALVKVLTNTLAPELNGIPTLADEKVKRTQPKPKNVDVKGSNYWKYAAPTALAPEFQNVIMSRAADNGGLWAIVSFDRLSELYRSGEVLDNARIKQLWSV